MILSDLQDVEAEKSLLRLLINKIDFMAEINEQLETEDFFSVANQCVYTALKEMFEKDINVDLVTVADYLTTTGKIETVGGITYLTDLYNGIMNEGSIGKYVEIIKDNSRRRCATSKTSSS